MKFPSDFIEKVRDASNIADIIGQYTQLSNAGGDLKGLCPFPDHNEKTPSFSVSQNKQVYHCFGCKKGGNVFTFLQTYNGMNFPEAIEYLAQRAQIPLPKLDTNWSKEDARKIKKKEFLHINRFSCEFFKNNLVGKPESNPIVQYLRRRGLDQEIVEKFSIGYSGDGWEQLVTSLKNKSLNLNFAEDLGLIKRKKSGESYFDIFRERIIFPIFSPSNEVLGFGGRVLGDGQPKYLNSPESIVFHKGKTLYGLHETAKHIRAENYVIVVEGYMDLIALYSKGFKNVVANLGTAFTEEHAKLLKRYSKNILVLFDGDSAGKMAARRALPVLLSQNLFPKALILPDSMDPDDYLVKYGAEGLKKIIGKAPEMYTWFLNEQLETYSGQATEKVEIVDKLSPVLIKISDPRLKKLYFDQTHESLGVSAEWLKSAVLYYLKNGRSFANNQVVKTSGISEVNFNDFEKNSDYSKIDVVGAAVEELELLRLAVVSQNVIESDTFLKCLPMLRHKGIEGILQFLLGEYRQDAENFDKLAALVASKLKDPQAITEVLDQDKYNEDATAIKLLNACAARIQLNFTKWQLKSLQKKSGSIDSAEHVKQVLEVMKKYKTQEI